MSLSWYDKEEQWSSWKACHGNFLPDISQTKVREWKDIKTDKLTLLSVTHAHCRLYSSHYTSIHALPSKMKNPTIVNTVN